MNHSYTRGLCPSRLWSRFRFRHRRSWQKQHL